MTRALKTGGLLALAGLIAWFVYYGMFLSQALPGGTGLVAKHLCSLHYVSGLPVDKARALYIDPFVQPLSGFLDITVDREEETLTAVGFGLATSIARHRQGYGCTLVYDGATLEPSRASLPDLPPAAVNTTHRQANFDLAALDTAVDAAFANDENRRNTLAVAVYHAGELVAERYAEGVDATTPLPGWSMSKSVTATLVGILADRNLLDVEAPGALPEWRDSNDPRAAITIDHLLRMTSGLNLVENKSGADVNTRMLFTEPDGAAFSAQQPLLYDVATTYEYMSGSTVLASRAVHETVGGDLATTYAWLDDNLFAPLNMHTAVLEPDQAGTFIGSSFMLASAHDWGQLGLLWLNRGVYRGERLLSEAWVDYALSWTPQSGAEAYGAGFWLNQYDGDALRWPELPADAFAMNGFQSQNVYMVPSADLVVVRLGASTIDPRVRPLLRGILDARL